MYGSNSSSVEFFAGLGVIGWLGIILWIVFFILVLTNSKKFTRYDDRFPKFDFWDEFLYEEWHYTVFMVVRFLIMLLILYVVTKIMFIF